MAFVYEPGPLEFLNPDEVPVAAIVGPTMESVAAPASASLFREEGKAVSVGADVAEGGIPDVDGAFAATAGTAIGELALQLSTLDQLDLSEAIGAFGASVADTEQILSELPAESSRAEPQRIPVEGGTFVEVEFVEEGATQPPEGPQPEPPQP